MKREELIEYKADENFGNGLVYSIPEVNQVLDEKDAEIERLRGESCKLTDGCLRLKQCRKEKANIADKLRHSNRKRCLAMARWCRIHDEFTQLESERLGLSQRALFIEYRRKAMWWNKWYKRWLELAEKFKKEN